MIGSRSERRRSARVVEPRRATSRHHNFIVLGLREGSAARGEERGARMG
jgi:hypothetical protein